MEQARATGRQRRLLVPASLFGMVAIVAFPLSATPAGRAAPLLVFATPITLLLVGVLRRQPALLVTGAGLALLLLALAVLRGTGVELGLLGIVAPLVLLVGPIVAVVTVGLPLRELDLVAAGAFLVSGTIAVIAGFATAATSGAAELILAVGLIGVAIVTARLTQRSPDDGG